MSGRLQPTQWALSKCSDLGAAMARAEWRIQPILDRVNHHQNYVQFLQAHRLQLSTRPELASWGAHLQRLIDNETRLLGCDLVWDAATVHERVIVPMRCAFWYGWEAAVGLRELYDDACVQAMRKASSAPPAYGMAPADMDEAAEAKHWEKLAKDAFGTIEEAEAGSGLIRVG